MKDLEACQRDFIDTKKPNDPLTVTDDNSNLPNFHHGPAAHWYWAGAVVVTLVFIAGAVLTWCKWGTVSDDLGIELYTSSRLSHGAVLYRDLFFFAGGPFPQYFDALLFKIFGASVFSFAISNLAAVAVTLTILFRRFAAAADTWTAVTICLAFVVLFAFPYYFSPGFNYLAPYCEDMVHGTVLSILSIAFFSDSMLKRRLRFAILAGFCTGLVFLTKADIFLALAVADLAAFGLLLFLCRKPGFALKTLAVFLPSALIPPLFFFFFFLRVEDWHDSLRSVVFAWVPVFNGAVINQPFYRWCTGMDYPVFHLKNILFQSSLVAAVTVFYAIAFRIIKNHRGDWTRIQQRAVPAFVPVLLILIYADHWLLTGESVSTSFFVMLACLWPVLTVGAFLLSTLVSNWKPNVYRSPWAIVLLSAAPLVMAARTADWIDCGYSLPLLALVSCAFIYWHRDVLADQQRFVFPFLWSVFAMVLLSKMGLFPRIWHYGFALAMPAFVAGIYCLFWLLPLVLEKRWQVPALYFRGLVWITLMAGFWALFQQSARNYALQTDAVGSGPNRMLAADTTEHVKDFDSALDWIGSHVPENATLTVLPQAPMVNFLAGRINPTPCVFWNQLVVAIFGEAKMTVAFESSPPDYVLIVEPDSPVDSSHCFGSPGNGHDVMQWIKENYRRQVLFGYEPLKSGQFGIEILKRFSKPSVVSHWRLAGTKPPMKTVTPPVQSGGPSFSRSARRSDERNFIPTTKEASVQPKPSRVM